MLARESLPGFREDIVHAHEHAAKLITALVASGKVIDRTSPHASNIHLLEMSEAMAAAAFERGGQTGVRIRRWQRGVVAIRQYHDPASASGRVRGTFSGVSWNEVS